MARAPFKSSKQQRLVYVSTSGGLCMVHVLNEGSHSNGSSPRPTWPHAQPYTYSWVYPYMYHKTTCPRVAPRVRYIPIGTMQ